MQRPDTLTAFLALEPSFSNMAASPGSLRTGAAIQDLHMRPSSQQDVLHTPTSRPYNFDQQQPQQQFTAANTMQQRQQQQQQGGQRLPPLPLSTQTLLLPVSQLLRSASPSPSRSLDDLYSAGKALDVPLSKVLKRHWFLARRALTGKPLFGALSAAVAVVLLVWVGWLLAARLGHPSAGVQVRRGPAYLRFGIFWWEWGGVAVLIVYFSMYFCIAVLTSKGNNKNWQDCIPGGLGGGAVCRLSAAVVLSTAGCIPRCLDGSTVGSKKWQPNDSE